MDDAGDNDENGHGDDEHGGDDDGVSAEGDKGRALTGPQKCVPIPISTFSKLEKRRARARRRRGRGGKIKRTDALKKYCRAAGLFAQFMNWLNKHVH